MSKIELLDQNTINKIAAGEVVERPAAVVKELIENAIDAGANAVTCEIKEGGISFIRITDNGSGIARDDIDTAFLRHATSKIRSVEDLLCVSSLGFRGEALASIASVAQVEMLTKTAKDVTGVRYCIEGGEKKSMEEIGCPNGTTFIVRNLFYNTPARRKFLKSATTEAGYINDLMMRLSVSHPEVSFKFIHNNQIKLHTSGNNNLKDILYSIYGREIANNLMEVSCEAEGIRIHGYIGKPIISRGNRTYENYYINGRYIRSSVICKAIEEAFKPFIMQHKYPFTAIHYEIDTEYIDVNVHPTKLEIRFRNGDFVYQTTYNAVSEALSSKEMIPEIELSAEKKQKTKINEAAEPFEANRMKREQSVFFMNKKPKTSTELHQVSPVIEIKSQESNRHENIGNTNTMADTPESLKDTEIGKLNHIVHHAYEYGKEKEEQPKEESKDTSGLSIFEQLRRKREALQSETAVEKQSIVSDNKADAYITTGNQLDLFGKEPVDQTEEQTENTPVIPFLSEEAKKKHKIIGQLFDTYWIVQYEDKMFIIDQHAAHEKVLFEKTMKKVHEQVQMSQMIEPPIVISLTMREEEALVKHKKTFEKLGYEIENFGGKEYSIRAVPSDMMGIADKDLILEILDDLVADTYERDASLVLEKVASMSCKAAIKGNMKLSYQEADDLIDQLLQLENPYHCPHGRPVIVSMSKYELEKKFKRII